MLTIDCENEQNRYTRKDLTALGSPLSFFVDDGIKEITNDVGQKTYIEVDSDCVCKTHPTNFISD